MLIRVVNGIEGGFCMAARAFSNVQPTIWNKTEKDLLVQTCVYNDAGMKAIKV